MNRITISVTPEIEQAMRREARRQGCSVSAVARTALGNHLHAVLEPEQKRDLSIIGLGSSGKPPIADRVDEVLAEEWGHPDFGRGR